MTSVLPFLISSMIRAALARTGCKSVLLLLISSKTRSNGRPAFSFWISSTSGAKSTWACTGRGSTSVLNLRIPSITASFFALRSSADRLSWVWRIASVTTEKSMKGLARRSSWSLRTSSSTGEKSISPLTLWISSDSLAEAASPFCISASTGEKSTSVLTRRISASISGEFTLSPTARTSSETCEMSFRNSLSIVVTSWISERRSSRTLRRKASR
mmetsp:Transcript_87237/g.241975  ORF Transcript_87237/g.241975 Transcript_87237/m.241975 type:complete len:215 (-) Transcript_87237:358-1002(-)